MLNDLKIELSIAFIVSFLIALIIIIRFAFNTSKSIKRNDMQAVQASHVTPVARIGGLSVFIALVLVAIPYLESRNIWLSYPLLLLSAFPVFIVGFCEDLGYFSSPRLRLMTAVLSGVVFLVLFEQWLPRTDIPGLDFAMQWAPIGIGFSLFFAAGISHAFNLIDGLNGLTSFIAIGVALSLALISHQLGLVEHRDVLLILISAISGFLIFNFPLGKIFLGDGGAYAIGHILIWMAISILRSAPAVTPLAMLLIFFYPVADTLLAIMRRLYLGAPISHPDRLHFHQLIMRGIEIVVLGRNRRYISNPLATVLILPLAFSPMLAGILLVLDRNKAMIALLLFGALFFMVYKISIWIIPQFRSFERFKRPVQRTNRY